MNIKLNLHLFGNGWDDEYLSQAQLDSIEQKREWARAGKDSSGNAYTWNDAHNYAEGVRSNYGYSGGTSGATPTVINSDTYKQATYNNVYNNANAEAEKRYQDIITNYQNTLAEISNANNAAAAQWSTKMQGYEDQINELMNQITTLGEQTYTPSEADLKYEQLVNEAVNMNFDDWTTSDQYQALADRYGYQGQLSMQDLLGQISARSGGLASSYATSAAQQQYNDYMADLESVARNQFNDERSVLAENAGLFKEMGEEEYNRYLDQLNQKNTGNSYALNILNNLLGYAADGQSASNALAQDAINTQYAVAQDAYNTQYKQTQTEKAEAQDRIYSYLTSGGKISNLDANLIAKSGYTTAELNQMQAAGQQATTTTTTAKKEKTETAKTDYTTLLSVSSYYNPGSGKYEYSWNGNTYSSSTGLLNAINRSKDIATLEADEPGLYQTLVNSVNKALNKAGEELQYE